MSAVVPEIKEAPAESQGPVEAIAAAPVTSKLRVRTLLAIPAACLIAMAVHGLVSKNQSASETRLYFYFLGAILALAIAGAALQPFSSGLRKWMKHMCAIIAAAVLLLTLWEVITSGLRLLPLPYFPGPAGVLQSLVNDRALLFDSTWHSLILLVSGYLLGVVIALISGICIGWFARARYWGMPLL